MSGHVIFSHNLPLVNFFLFIYFNNFNFFIFCLPIISSFSSHMLKWLALFKWGQRFMPVVFCFFYGVNLQSNWSCAYECQTYIRSWIFSHNRDANINLDHYPTTSRVPKRLSSSSCPCKRYNFLSLNKDNVSKQVSMRIAEWLKELPGSDDINLKWTNYLNIIWRLWREKHEVTLLWWAKSYCLQK